MFRMGRGEEVFRYSSAVLRNNYKENGCGLIWNRIGRNLFWEDVELSFADERKEFYSLIC